MNDDERPQPRLPKLPFTKELLPEDPEAIQLPHAHHQSRMFDDDYGSRHPGTNIM